MKTLLLLLFCGNVFAGSIYLNAPAYPWGPGVAHSNVAQAFVTGFDSAGNPTGICTYYNSRGFVFYADCGWDLSGKPLYAIPLTVAPKFTYGTLGQFTLPTGYTAYGWDQAHGNGYTLWLEGVLPQRRSVLEAP
jgi:hypothetical protein